MLRLPESVTILIIEDQKSMAHYMQKKLQEAIPNCNVLICYSLTEAENLLEKSAKNIALCLSDLNLPDAPNGESVSVLAKHNITTVVFTSSYNEQIRERMYQQRVADYVIKDGEASINYAVESVKQILINPSRVIWIVAPMTSRSAQEIRGLLCVLRYQLKVFSSFRDLNYALARSKPNLILIEDALEISDDDVFSVVSKIRQDYNGSELPIISCETTQKMETAIKLMKYGVNDFFNSGFTAEELYIRVRQGIGQSEAYQEIRLISQTDALTHLFNRRHFFELANNKLQQPLKDAHTFFVVMADIDFFKQVNDEYGHQTGDKAIVFTAKSIQQIFKEHTVARIGGEEFGIFGVAANQQAVLSLCETLRAEIETQSKAQTQVPFTLSQGIHFGQESLEKLMGKADKALYDAKDSGRNRVCIFQPH